MTGTMRPQDLIDSPVVDPAGSKIGKVGTVYLSDDTHQPEWVTVKTGLFGHRESFVPLDGADLANDGLHVQVDKDQVTDAPQIDADGHLSPEDSGELYRYYGLPMQRDRAGEDRADRKRDSMRRDKAEMGGMAGTTGAAGTAGMTGRDKKTTAGMTGKGKEATAAKHELRDAEKQRGGEDMIRSEERFNVGTEEVEAGRVRLRKYVVTEEQQVSVPVSHEEVHIEREPITDGEAGKARIGEAEQDVILHAEKPVVRKEAVPVERVRMGKERVTDTETVTGELRKEQIEIDDDSKLRDRDRDRKNR
ncbi:PRC and DUF2382 domain-containing protein [Amycolatopsis magusensis]|uniref:Uncharacterized protein (TIGR02271 family) n=1 Tax=Amycolatopsis magusensis TaxID=882444 RepID=A0ABS4PJE4_9PSEU|nr:PRC and DUF2382 domain-containing protein [Amycolatopsis magusensis]MBP2178974.1 uncharacterized protein (TIGR02271 family) [Amycolatopsis magusensis]MDI5978433.1 PRC and DUF2382 domain-containing protein [Amycolatopsis magusensis]